MSVLFTRYSIIILMVQSYAIFSDWADQTISSMSLDQKIGQLFVVAATSVFPTPPSVYQTNQAYIEALITHYHIGGLLFLFEGNIEEQVRLYTYYNTLSNIPLWCLQDFEWGLNMRFKDGMRFPKQIALGHIKDNSLLIDLGKEIARQCKAIHVHMNLAPVVDIHTNIDNPIIGKRSFGTIPELVCKKAAALIHGLKEGGVLTCVKHFPGHGDSSVDSHTTIPILEHDIKRLENIELKPFLYLIDQVDAIMIGHLKVPIYDSTNVASMSKKIVTELLRKKMGFKGLIITDGLGMQSVHTKDKKPGELELQALLAGNDILLAPVNVPAAIAKIKDALNNGIITQEELDSHVLRILQAKQKAGLTHHGISITNDILQTLNTPTAYNLQRKLYTETITVIKGSKDIFRNACKQEEITLLQYNGGQDNCFLEQCTQFGFSAEYHFIKQNADKYEEPDGNVVILSICDTKNINADAWQYIQHLITLIKKQNKQIAVIIFDTANTTAWYQDADLIILAHEDTVEAQTAVAEMLFN